MFIKIFLFLILFINSSIAHELRPAIANLNFNEKDNIINAELSIRINLEAIIAGIDNKHSNTKDSENSKTYENLRLLEPDQLKNEFILKNIDLQKKIFLKSKNQIYEAQLKNLFISEVGNVNIIRDSIITLYFNEIKENNLTFKWDKSLGTVILRVNSKDNQDIHTQLLENKDESDVFSIDKKHAKNFLKNIKSYIALGFEHILPKGLDHILFVLALFLLSTRIKVLILQISFFTIAHTITLFLGVLEIIKIAPYIVEPIIALSIVYVGIENLFKDNLSKSRTIIVFLFGLLHGLGFAGILKDVGLAREYFISSLISFNIGVELGQISVIILAYFLIKLPFYKMQWYSNRITKPISILISLIGVYWFFERLFF